MLCPCNSLCVHVEGAEPYLKPEQVHYAAGCDQQALLSAAPCVMQCYPPAE